MLQKYGACVKNIFISIVFFSVPPAENQIWFDDAGSDPHLCDCDLLLIQILSHYIYSGRYIWMDDPPICFTYI